MKEVTLIATLRVLNFFWEVNKVDEVEKTDQSFLFVGRNAFEKLECCVRQINQKNSY